MPKEHLQLPTPTSLIRDSWNGFLTQLHLDRLNINPNRLTEAGIASGIAAGFAISQGKFKLALGLLAASGFFDTTDGFMAKAQGKTSEWGAFLDSVGDRLVDFALLTGIKHWAKKQGWKGAETLAQITRTASLNVSLTRTVAESEDIVGLKEQGLGSRLPRLLTVTALCLLPQERAWEAGLGFLAAASGVTGIERTVHMFTSSQPYSKEQISKKRLKMFKKLATTYLRWIGTASLKNGAREKRFSEFYLFMADLGMASDYTDIKAGLVTGNEWKPNLPGVLIPVAVNVTQRLRHKKKAPTQSLPQQTKDSVRLHRDEIAGAAVLGLLGLAIGVQTYRSMNTVYQYQPQPKTKN